jgi:hypothetical protein
MLTYLAALDKAAVILADISTLGEDLEEKDFVDKASRTIALALVNNQTEVMKEIRLRTELLREKDDY